MLITYTYDCTTDFEAGRRSGNATTGLRVGIEMLMTNSRCGAGRDVGEERGGVFVTNAMVVPPEL